ncbi:hypothetical protein ABB29_15185 [Pseudoxanthomonas dokdonensis]|uniref:Uncharacterized protein n=1 Tax=Pseudoxanthomonas dokdonensis TaxID=344882 RepID=A0A0R0CDR7_9GAMM|nr:hypothetical protein ABB29_15185 [Pseudoxanthomonas dokdonensis]
MLLLAGCASTQTASLQPDQPLPQTRVQVNSDYVAEVERKARMRGVEVNWVNQPRRIVAVTPDTE